MQVDVAGLSEEELAKIIVGERCSQFGAVANVYIVKEDGRHAFALAAVEMSTPSELLDVLRRLGESKVDSMVVIRLEQEEKTAASPGRA